MTKEQRAEKKKKYYQENKDRILEQKKEYYSKHKERISVYGKEHYKESGVKERSQVYKKKYYQKNKDLIKAKAKEYANNPEAKKRRKIYRREYEKEYRNRPEVIKRKKKQSKEWYKNYYEENKEKIIKTHNQYQKKRRSNDKEFNIKIRIRRQFNHAFNKYILKKKIMNSKKYGMDYEKIIEHLKPFPDDVSKYHIDHIQPVCSFKFINGDGSINMEEIKKCFAPENLRWLLIKDNLIKSNLDKKSSIYSK